jgi:hypothetical protein
MMNRRGWSRGVLAGAATMMAALAFGQEAAREKAASVAAAAPVEGTTNGRAYLDLLSEHFGVIVAVVIGLLVLGYIIYYLVGRRGQEAMEDMYSESVGPVESSRFEQVLAETQGLSLRIQGGESKGYYRKIEQLTRIFMERAGYRGARAMSEAELQALLNGGSMPQNQAAALSSIFERCKQGSDHETRKLDFTAGELIKELRDLVKQAEEAPPQRSA